MNELLYIAIAVVAGLLALLFGSKKVLAKREWGAVGNHYTDIQIASIKSGVPVAIIAAVMWQESRGVPGQTGSAGEIGLMQLKQIAVNDLVQNGYAVEEIPSDDNAMNILQGAYFIALQKRRAKDWYNALRSYNAGYAGAMANPNAGKAYAESVINQAVNKYGWSGNAGTI